MKQRFRIPHLGGATAAILHRPHQTVAAVERQLQAIGIHATVSWPDLPASALAADFIFFDVDLGHDEQFPWMPGEAPMPLIAMIGSEAPGRIEWAINHKADAHLLKPVSAAGVYSALLIGRQSYAASRAMLAVIDDLREQVEDRQILVRAVILLAQGCRDGEQAYAQLRALAMNWQVTMESAARRVVEMSGKSDEWIRRLNNG